MANNIMGKAKSHIDSAQKTVKQKRVSRNLNVLKSFFNSLSTEEKEKLKKITLKFAHKEETQTTEKVEIIEFKLDSETYGIESSKTVETISLKNFTPLPKTPDFLFGLVNIRGRIIGVINLKSLFGLALKSMTDMNRVIVLRNKDFQFGVLADEIIGIKSVDFNLLSDKLATLDGQGKKYLKGIMPDGLVILDADKIANDPALVIETEI